MGRKKDKCSQKGVSAKDPPKHIQRTAPGMGIQSGREITGYSGNRWVMEPVIGEEPAQSPAPGISKLMSPNFWICHHCEHCPRYLHTGTSLTTCKV